MYALSGLLGHLLTALGGDFVPIWLERVLIIRVATENVQCPA